MSGLVKGSIVLWLSCYAVVLVAPLGAQDAAAPPQGTPEIETQPPRTGSQTSSGSLSLSAGDTSVHKPLGPQLFPFYEHYERTQDGTRVRNILYLYQTTANEDGSWSRLLAPFFFRGHSVRPPEETLHLYPLLFFHKKSEAESYNYAVPFYFHQETPDKAFKLLFPLWWRHASEGKKLSRDHVLFPLYRHTRDDRDPDRPLRTNRFGLWKILELWESRTGPGTYDHKALNFFNWRDDTLGGLSVYASSWVGEGDQRRGRTYLFPFFWTAHEPGWSYRTVFPFYWQGSGLRSDYLWLPPVYFQGTKGDSRYLWAVPFFGHSDGAKGFNTWILPLLGGFGAGPEGARRLWQVPLFVYSRGPKSLWAGSPLLYDYSHSEEYTEHGFLFWLLRSRRDVADGNRNVRFLYPLGNFDFGPNRLEGASWFPPYFERFSADSRWRTFVPLYLEKQSLSGGDLDSYWRVGLPLYFSRGTPEEHFSVGFPLYWSGHRGAKGWQTLFPLLFHSYNATSRGVHVPMVFSWRRFPSKKQLFLGGPLYGYERHYDFNQVLTRTTHHFPWPIATVSTGKSGYHFRLLPLFWVSKNGEERDLMLTPLYYQQTGPTRNQRYFLPIYGRYEDASVTRKLYALGTYAETEYRDENGTPVSEQTDLFWKLASFRKSLVSEGSHQHILPLAFWQTKTPSQDRTIAGPLYYSHRTIEGEREHHLKLVLGTLFYSRRVEDLTPPAKSRNAVVSPEAASVPATNDGGTSNQAHSDPNSAASETTGGSSLFPLSPPESEARPGRRIVEEESGVLWPLSGSYRKDADRERGSWVAPFYFDVEDRFGSNLAFWPFYFRQQDHGAYDPNYFRYFFLFDRETWDGGYRFTFGQLLFDWLRDEKRERLRWRFLYPLVQHERTANTRSLELLSPLYESHTSTERGERVVARRLFPLYWQGSRSRKPPGGDWKAEEKHLFLLPLGGVHMRPTRTDYYALFPLFHLLRSEEALNFELWPSIFYRNEPGLRALRLWPLHAHEDGQLAGDFWVSRYLFLSKYFHGPEKTELRIDPGLFSYEKTSDGVKSSALFHLYVNNRGTDTGWFHLFPIAFSGREGKSSFTSIVPLHYRRDFGEEEIDYFVPWRFLSLSDHMKGASGERHTGILWKLFEYTDNVNDPSFHETRVMHALYHDRETQSSRQLAVNPFFSYYRNDEEDDMRFSLFLSLYSYQRSQGRAKHTLFYFLRF